MPATPGWLWPPVWWSACGAKRGSGIQTGVSTVIGGTLNLWTQPGRPAQDWDDYLAMTGRRTAGVEVDVVMTAFEDGGKLNLRLRW